MAASPADEYVGNELELFSSATNWKQYLASRIQPYLSGDVLEVGAGIGTNVPYLHSEKVTRWLSLEPDLRLCAGYRDAKDLGVIPGNCELMHGTIESLSENESFDTILYIDVLEHIEDDQAEFARAFTHLRPGGHLVILCPAHDALYSAFDRSIGHFRRYNKRLYSDLSRTSPYILEYLDSVGMIASLANKYLLRQPYPALPQIHFWDRVLLRLSRLIDPLLRRTVGKSILGIWVKSSLNE